MYYCVLIWFRLYSHMVVYLILTISMHQLACVTLLKDKELSSIFEPLFQTGSLLNASNEDWLALDAGGKAMWVGSKQVYFGIKHVSCRQADRSLLWLQIVYSFPKQIPLVFDSHVLPFNSHLLLIGTSTSKVSGRDLTKRRTHNDIRHKKWKAKNWSRIFVQQFNAICMVGTLEIWWFWFHVTVV